MQYSRLIVVDVPCCTGNTKVKSGKADLNGYDLVWQSRLVLVPMPRGLRMPFRLSLGSIVDQMTAA